MLSQQLPQVLDGERYALDEVRFLLEIATETIGTQHLQGAEQYEVTQLTAEIALIHRHVFAQRRDVIFQQLLPQLFGIFGFRLPKERGDIVKDRSFAPSLEVNKPWLALLDHHVARLEVAIEEGGG